MKDQHKAQPGERWRFTVNCPRTDRVYLVQREAGSSTWHEMEKLGPSLFTLDQVITPGQHQFHYFTNTGGTYINCGTEGLRGNRLSAPDPTVGIEPFEVAMTA